MYAKRRDHRSRAAVAVLTALFIILACLMSAGTAAYAAGRQQTKDDDQTEYTLPVFHTSDVHGYLANKSGEEYQYLLAYISDKVKDVRGYGEDNRKDLAVLLDAGDIYQGSTLSNLLLGSPLSAAYQIMGYDAVTIGNHEFDWWIDYTIDDDCTMMDYTVGEMSGVNSVPVVVANLYHDGEKVDFAQDYVSLEKTALDENGEELPVRIAVIGLVGEYAASIKYDHFSGAGFSVEEGFDRVNQIAAELESDGQCDATILLCHEEAHVIAESIGKDSVIDLVLGGHTHQNLRGKTEWDLTYLQPANYGSAYTYSELVFRMEDGKPVFCDVQNAKTVSTKKKTSKLVNVPENAEELDPELTALTDEVIEELDQVLKEEVGYITEPALRYTYLEGSGERSTTCGNWITSLLRRMVGADVSFVNSGALRVDLAIEEGSDRRSITLSDIYMMFPFNNLTCCFEITYEDLLEVLDYSLMEGSSDVLSQMSGIDCYYTDQTVNAIVTADGLTVYANGKWRDGWREKTLLAAVSDYIATKEGEDEKGRVNPFYEWSLTDRLIDASMTDNEGACAVLREEALANDGLLTIDTEPHYINAPHEDIPPEEQEGAAKEETETANTETTTAAVTEAEPETETGRETEPTTQEVPETTSAAEPETREEEPGTGDGTTLAFLVVLALSVGILLVSASNRRD